MLNDYLIRFESTRKRSAFAMRAQSDDGHVASFLIFDATRTSPLVDENATLSSGISRDDVEWIGSNWLHL